NELHLNQQSFLQPDHETQNANAVENLEEQTENQASRFSKPNRFSDQQRLGLRGINHLDAG
ncbi:hypothetical protein, partial [Vibrio penaeicida]|uniref:hypothetical protein n=1 Tax=Vibrio penaeicida TaxID=104609 RepID=UPI0024E0AC75